jgi:UTP-glucose-1-phosphate uridylyltransferase
VTTLQSPRKSDKKQTNKQKMKVIVLAAGYGTRFEKDIVEKHQEYSDLIGTPKALLPLNHRPLIDYWIQTLRLLSNNNNDVIDCNKDVYIVTNDILYPKFEKWAKENHFPIENVLNDGTKGNANRLGAISDIQFCISHYQTKCDKAKEEDLMVIGGDTLFSLSFHTHQLAYIMERENFLKCKASGPVLLYYTLDPSVNISEKGILEVKKLDQERALITKFIEKPKPNETNSRLACPCFYLLDASSVPLIQQFLDNINQTKQDNNDSAASLALRDAPGHFVKFLTEQKQVIAYELIGPRFDVGHLSEYLSTNEYFEQNSFL